MIRYCFALALCAATPAAADDAPYATAISLQLPALATTGIAAQAEQLVGDRVSIVGALGVRTAARGEFDSATVGAGSELRYWLRASRAPMTSAYVAVRTDLARTSIEDTVAMREIGTLWTWTAGASLGFRWVIRHAVEITPALGMSAVVEGGLAGRSPTTVRGAATVGLTAGWIF